MPLFIVIIISLILCCRTTTNPEAFFKCSLIAFIVGMYIFYLIALENNKKEIEIARQNNKKEIEIALQNTLNNMHTLLEKHQ